MYNLRCKLKIYVFLLYVFNLTIYTRVQIPVLVRVLYKLTLWILSRLRFNFFSYVLVLGPVFFGSVSVPDQHVMLHPSCAQKNYLGRIAFLGMLELRGWFFRGKSKLQ